jgi:hypothetical protein
MSQTKKERPKASKKPLERHVVLMDRAGAHNYTLSTESLAGFHAALDELAEQGWLPVLLAYEVLRHFEVKPNFQVLDAMQAHYEEDKG